MVYKVWGSVLYIMLENIIEKKDHSNMATSTNHVIRGRLDWAKVIGAPRMNTYSGEKEWSVDVTPDKKGRLELKRIGAEDRLKTPKEKDSRTESFIAFRQRELRPEGADGKREKNDPIKIIDSQGRPWGNSLIGNGTIADIKFTKKDYGPGKKAGFYIQAIRVLDLVEFESQDFAPLDEDDAYFASAEDDVAESPDTKAVDKSPSLDDLEDDIPFDPED
jgi:hypothetical protein